MYYPGQVVWSLDHQKPVKIGDDVWDTKSYPGKTTHFMNSNGKAVCPKTIKEATLLLKRSRIVPAPMPESHCWDCGSWRSHAPTNECNAKEEHYRCVECNAFSIDAHRFGQAYCHKCVKNIDKTGLLTAAEELVVAIKTGDVAYGGDDDIRTAMNKIKELLDPYKIREDGDFRDKLQDMIKQYQCKNK